MDSLFTGLILFSGFILGLTIYGLLVWFIVNKVVDLVDKVRGRSR
jgi:F0F1-type ATP synthase membrane subunit c/vacuolar-type H+-ATPase subunit K